MPPNFLGENRLNSVTGTIGTDGTLVAASCDVTVDVTESANETRVETKEETNGTIKEKKRKKERV
jgi:hypothetical protein